MYTFQRKLTIKQKNFDVWFGLNSKRSPSGNIFSIYLYSDSPKSKLSEGSLLKGGFKCKEDAISYGMDYVKELYKNQF
jgi:hypothetical protein